MNWKYNSQKLSKLTTNNNLHSAVIEQLSKDCHCPWTIACSGGADSIYLTLLLYSLFQDNFKNMTIVHFNHKLRSIDSDKDEEFVRKLTEDLGLKFFSGEWNLENNKTINEKNARDARYDFIEKVMNEVGSKILLLGHHKNDIIETLLIRLSRGSGLTGLAAPRPVQIFNNGIIRLRPLLNITKEKIISDLRSLNIPWCEDKTNHENKFLRNKIRNNVIPILKKSADRDVIEGIAQSREILEESDDALQFWLETLIDNPEKNKSYNLNPLLDKPLALVRRALTSWLRVNNLNENLNRVALNQLIFSIKLNKKIKVSAGKNLTIKFEHGVISKTIIDVLSKWHEFFSPTNVTIFFPHGNKLILEKIVLDDKLVSTILNGNIDQNSTAYISNDNDSLNSVLIRTRLPGDRYNPLGSSNSIKLQDMMVNYKVASVERNTIPLVCNNHKNILWVPGFPPSNNQKITETTRRALRLTYL